MVELLQELAKIIEYHYLLDSHAREDDFRQTMAGFVRAALGTRSGCHYFEMDLGLAGNVYSVFVEPDGAVLVSFVAVSHPYALSADCFTFSNRVFITCTCIFNKIRKGCIS